MSAYGRTDEIKTLHDLPHRYTVLSGESGFGKSTILEALAATADSARPRSSVQTLKARPGALQQGLLDGLTDVAGQVLTFKHTAKDAVARLANAAKSMATDHLNELGTALVREVLGILRSKLGPEFGSAIGEYIEAVRKEDSKSLQQRIAAQADKDVLKVVLSLAGQVAKLTPSGKIQLTLDNGERLGEGDLAQLLDLPDEAPEGVHVIIGFRSSIPKDAADIRKLLDRGWQEQVVAGIDSRSIRRWLADESIDASWESRISRLSSGSPLVIADLIRRLQAVGHLDHLDVTDSVGRITFEILSSLPIQASGAARRLSAFFEPPPRAEIADFLSIAQSDWTEIEQLLWQAGIFSSRVNDQRWFHDQRRRAIWAELDATDQESFARAAIEYFKLQLLSIWTPNNVISLAALGYAYPDALVADEDFRTVAASTEAELALIGALIELSEFNDANDEYPSVEASGLFNYVRSNYSPGLDLEEALAELHDRSVISTASNEYATIVVPNLARPALALLAGRAGIRFGRVPVLGLSSALFNSFLRPRLGRFKYATFGIGHPPASQLANTFREMQIRQNSIAGHTVYPNAQEPGLLIRARHGDVNMYCAAAFESNSDRDEVQSHILRIEGQAFGQIFSTTLSEQTPGERVRILRWPNALELLTGNISNVFSSEIRLKSDGEISAETVVQRWSEAYRMIRAHSSPDERLAYNLERRLRLAYFAHDETLQLFYIRGNTDGAIRIQQLPQRHSSRWPAEIAELLGLPSTDSVTKFRGVSGRFLNSKDPIAELMTDLHKEASAFNSHQPRTEVLLSERDLTRMVEDSHRQALEDARLLKATVSVSHATVPCGRNFLIDINLNEGGSRFPSALHWGIDCTSFATDSGEPGWVDLRVVGHSSPSRNHDELMSSMTQMHPLRISGALGHVLPKLLGYDSDSIRFRRL